VALVALQLASSGTLKGFTLTAVADLLQFSIMLLMVVGTAINIRPSRGSARGFWSLMTVSAVMWAVDYGFWVYYEIVRRVAMPVPHPGDTLLILHVIPIMMALAMSPHRSRDRSSPSTNLEFPLIACWWVYLYFQFVFVWMYLYYDAPTFHRNFNLLYHTELATTILGFLYLAHRSRAGWHDIFNHYLMGFLIYAPTSAIINILIQQKLYSSGGLWDLPLTASIAYLAWIGFHARKLQPKLVHEKDREPGLAIQDWLASLAAVSVPAIALFSFGLHQPLSVQHFRIVLSLVAMLVIALLIFTRQQLLHHRLAHLLSESKRSYENLERLQSQIMQAEKLASIGKLVSGAAHELNNPLAAILGYSELISEDREVPELPRGFAEKITHQARRVKSLVESLLSFARQTSPTKRLIDINAVVTSAFQLRLATLPARISLVRNLQPESPLVMGDDSHLLQVVMHVLNNAVDSLEEVGGGEVVVRARTEGEQVMIEITDNGTGIAEPSRVFDPFYTTKPLGQGTGLGLSACYGIIQEHQGRIECFNLEPRGAMFRITLKAAKQAATETVAAS
jgi:signal transduction histidine kinase